MCAAENDFIIVISYILISRHGYWYSYHILAPGEIIKINDAKMNGSFLPIEIYLLYAIAGNEDH
jgi:hypothetical protein